MTEYEQLLNNAYNKIKQVEAKDRFEVPRVESHIEGIRTLIHNFLKIASYLRRNPEHLEKFLQRELAAPSKIDGDRLVLVKKILGKRIEEKIQLYVEKYVTCKECGKPDTELIKEGGFTFIHCLACGAKHSIAKI
ncbi:MAG: translation initiation factor IF-2 subunit beta [Candidatus Pacearchaeota archaeon]|nr:translation initiation factor IF-2 subunit beta [Candidatus Pacearchaeota archaeon]